MLERLRNRRGADPQFCRRVPFIGGVTGTLRTSTKGSRRVLVIDDDEIVLQAVADLLDRSGFQVYSMPSPIGATQAIVKNHIQAVVLDLNMPVMQGDRFVKLIRGWDRIRDLPVILLSGAPEDTLREVGRRFTGLQVISKDNMLSDLPRAVATAVASYRPAEAR